MSDLPAHGGGGDHAPAPNEPDDEGAPGGGGLDAGVAKPPGVDAPELDATMPSDAALDAGDAPLLRDAGL